MSGSSMPNSAEIRGSVVRSGQEATQQTRGVRTRTRRSSIQLRKFGMHDIASAGRHGRGRSQTRERALATEKLQHFEKTGTHGFPGDRDAGRMNEGSCLEAPALREAAERYLDRRLIEYPKGLHLVPGRREMVANPGRVEMLFPRRRVVVDLFNEEQPPLLPELGEPADTRLQQIDDSQQPVTLGQR